MKRSHRVRLYALLLAVLVAAVLSTPELGGLAWHLRHGSVVKYKQLNIPVPLDWLVTIDSATLAMGKLGRFPWQDSPVSTFLQLEVPSPATAQFPYDKWREVQTKQSSALNFLLAGERKIRVMGQEQTCLEFTHAQDGSRQHIECVVPPLGLFASFDGRRRYASDFYSVLERTTGTPLRRSVQAPAPGD
ncbi:MAG: hypothetical protein HY237_05895 [Acidobacteria bacterium]|nr:hypothetical protein [Acidobacteriota bacterium]